MSCSWNQHPGEKLGALRALQRSDATPLTPAEPRPFQNTPALPGTVLPEPHVPQLGVPMARGATPLPLSWWAPQFRKRSPCPEAESGPKQRMLQRHAARPGGTHQGQMLHVTLKEPCGGPSPFPLLAFATQGLFLEPGSLAHMCSLEPHPRMTGTSGPRLAAS